MLNYKKVISILMVLVLSLGTCFAASESSYCRMSTTPTIYATNYYFYCGYLYDLVKQRDSYVPEINKQKNNLKAYAAEEKALKASLGPSVVGATWDLAYGAVAMFGTTVSLGSLAFLDVAAATSFIANVSSLVTTNSQLKALQTKTLTAARALETAEKSYNSLQTKINNHIKGSGRICYKYVR